jgi:hypothetical protein
MEDDQKDFDEAFKGFGEEPEQPAVTPPTDPSNPTPPAPAAATPPEDEEPNKDDKTPPADPDKKEEEPVTPPANPEKKPEEPAKPPENPETPPAAPEAPKPLTADDVTAIIQNIRTDERTSGKELENTTKEVMEAYYPEGLSNVLVDQTSGKELRTPADVVAASGGEMSTEDAAQWLMNEQFKLDQNIAKINNDAKAIAETTVNFKRDSVAVLQKYEPLFKAYPHLQNKTFTKLMKLVKSDTEKGVVLSAPDVMEFYDDALEPYQQAFEYATKQSATNPTPAPGTPGAPATPPTPGQDDRLDEGGDGGTSEVDDPNDFAQQVKKELAKGL